ncbi:flocculation protein FLO11 [Aplysia californica]|uniref:Flocculation protein FLO11 n=1 Tax=Aplysia californica TaxID=6500 RepID=A0ABM1ABB2_APLCA|nr:flocculation protein FLO11 [Aplysia californica]
MAAGPHRSPASGQKGVSSRCRKGEPLSQKCTQMFRFGLLLFLTMFLTSSVPVALAQDSCPGVVTISEDWRDVNSLTSSNQAQCDVTSGTFNTQTWYSFELGTDADLATIPTVCLKNNTCGSDIALRIHLNGHAMPAMPGDVIEAQLCGAYNDGGIYDCCRPRGRVSVKNCQYGITAYKFHDVIQDCPSAVCLLKKGETVPDDVTAETGDVCPTEPVSEAEKDTPTTPITTPSTTGEETTTPVTKPPIPSTPADTTADTAANTTADTTANTTDTASPTPDVNNKNVSGGIEADDNNVSTIATNTDLDSGLSNYSLHQNVINPTPVYNNDTDDSDNATSSTVPVVILSNLTPASDPPSFNDTPTLSTNETTTPDLQDILDQSSNDSSPAANLSTSTQFPATPVTTDSVHTSTEDGTDLENTTDSLTTLPESSSSSSSPQPLSPSLSLSSSSPSSNESLPTPTDSEPPQTTPPLPDSASTNNETTDSPPTTTDPPPTPPASTTPPVMVADVAMTTTTIPEDATETSPPPPNPDTSSTDKTPRFPDDVVMIEKVRLVFKGSDEVSLFLA